MGFGFPTSWDCNIKNKKFKKEKFMITCALHCEDLPGNVRLHIVKATSYYIVLESDLLPTAQDAAEGVHFTNEVWMKAKTNLLHAMHAMFTYMGDVGHGPMPPHSQRVCQWLWKINFQRFIRNKGRRIWLTAHNCDSIARGTLLWITVEYIPFTQSTFVLEHSASKEPLYSRMYAH